MARGSMTCMASIPDDNYIGLELSAALMLVDRTFCQLKLAQGGLRGDRPNDGIGI